MGASKIIYFGKTLVDLTGDTVKPETLLKGTTAHDAKGDLITGTAMLIGGKERLPSGYAELTYIQSSGTQYIDTGFKPNQDTRVVLDARTTDVSISEYHCVFGCRGGGNLFELFKASQDSWEMTFLYGNSFTEQFEVDYGLRHLYEINKNVATIDNESRSYPATNFQTAYSLYLGATNNSGSALGITPMLIYSSQIYDNGVLVRDFVPCKTADDEVGLYDLVNDVFYVNNGTGEFVGGETVDSYEIPMWTGGSY